MTTRYVSSQLIRTFEKNGKSIAVDYVDKTTTWIRPKGFPSASVQLEFAKVAEKNAESLKPETTKIAMKESEHQSDMDMRVHYTAFELDKEGNVISTRHLVNYK